MKQAIKLSIVVVCAGISILYLSATTFIWARQAHFIYQPDRAIEKNPSDYGLVYKDVYIDAENKDNRFERIHAWLIPPAYPSDKYLIYLHGSALNIEANIKHAQRFSNLGFTVLLVSYRGYGKSDGVFPEEEQLYADAEAAWSYLVVDKRIAPESIYIYGHSLGGAIAIELAVNHPGAAGLIVEATFTSIVDMANLVSKFRVFPVRFIVNQQFDSKSKVAYLNVPVLYLHGTNDHKVPYEMSQILYAATSSAKKLKLIQGGGHNNSALVGGKIYLDAINEFITFSTKKRDKSISLLYPS
ncbi:MAG: alpha/beta fold hydrolase [Desulfobacterales bacterium]|nr:alpha/beta fold hydrolase [Desulfobacterales bacterium]